MHTQMSVSMALFPRHLSYSLARYVPRMWRQLPHTRRICADRQAAQQRSSLHSRPLKAQPCCAGSGSEAASPLRSANDIPDLAVSLASLYHEVQNPCNRSYSKAMAEFTAKAILAYECGYSEDSVREQIEGLIRANQLPHLQGFDPAACTEFVSLVWLTLMLSPRSVKRWATTPAVSSPTLNLWQGFVALIVAGYFDHRMAWYPLDRLALEINAVQIRGVMLQGRSVAQELVAERARVVFTALEVLHPQFPQD